MAEYRVYCDGVRKYVLTGDASDALDQARFCAEVESQYFNVEICAVTESVIDRVVKEGANDPNIRG